jgi:hypothetical protein
LLDRAGEGARPYTSTDDFRVCPDSRQSCYSLCGNCEVGAGAHQDIFEAADEFDYAERFALAVWAGESAQVKDRIADDLAGTVEGNVAAAVAFEEFDAAVFQKFWGGYYVCGFRISA